MWISFIPFEQAKDGLLKLYQRVTGPDKNVDNIMLAHSLRPHTMEGHMALYKSVLHHYGNSIPKWFLETLGVWVSHLNGCHYCFDHHFAGLIRLLDDNSKAKDISRAFATNQLTDVFDGKELAALHYAAKLTKHPADMVQNDILMLKAAGWKDPEILEVNQVVSYFAYANRTVLGLGVSTDGDKLGLSPSNSDDPNAWHHQ